MTSLDLEEGTATGTIEILSACERPLFNKFISEIDKVNIKLIII